MLYNLLLNLKNQCPKSERMLEDHLNYRTTAMNRGWQPNFAIVFQVPQRLNVLTALAR